MSEHHDTHNSPSNIIECRGIHKYYHDGSRELRILTGIDLAVPEGKLLAISGASGVGKSTLLHIMGTLDRPTSGEVMLRGKDVAQASRWEINRIRNEEIGFVFQFYHLLPEFSALENVMMPTLCRGVRRRTLSDRAQELLEAVGLKDRMTHKPGQLSGGEQQRVAIARALFNKPAVVLSDEPTGNLDEHTGASIIELLWALHEQQQVTVVIVTHDEAIADRAHHWVQLHEGRATVRK